MQRLIVPQKFRSLVALAVASLTAAVGIYVVSHSFAAGVPTMAEGNFKISGTNIVDPDNKVFTPNGANVSGPWFPWGGSLLGHSDYAENVWKWNTIRVNVCKTNSACINAGGFVSHDNDDLAAIVNEYTAKHIVVMIEWQQDPGENFANNSGEMTDALNFWNSTAPQFKNNPYVWFNTQNEPNNDSIAQWVSTQGQLVKAIRDAGANNIVTVDGWGWGQDDKNEPDAYNCDANMPYGNSSIINGGPQLESQYTNILFSLHSYSWWGGAHDGTCSAAQLKTRLSNYIDKVHATNLPLIIGETGALPYVETNPNAYTSGYWDGMHAAFAAAPSKGVGILVWHSAGNADLPLLSPGKDWWLIGDVNNAGNFTEMGKLIYNLGQTLAQTAPQTPVPATPAPTPVVYTAGSYNDSVLIYSGNWQSSTNAGEYQGDDHYSNTAGDSATLQFNGTQIKYWYSQAPHHGQATVFIDGVLKATIDLYAATRTDGTAFWASPTLAAGNHTLKISVTGTKSAVSTGTVIAVDRVDVLATATTPGPKTADMTGDGHVNIFDLSYLLSKWATSDTKADINSSGTVDIFDLSTLLSAWTG